jgi:conjugal transfer pilus assembly protein TraV
VTRQLTTTEMGSLNGALAKRTKGRVRAGPGAISVQQGIALWNATSAFGADPATRMHRNAVSGDTALGGRVAFRRVLNTTAVLAASVSLGACATLGGNVKGQFSCRAPDGVCAPTSTIDDAALALIVGDDGVTKTGPYTPEPTRQRAIPIVSTGPVRFGETGQSGEALSSSEPVRSSEKVLRIVFPAHIDELGRYRESTAIHAVVERGAWMTAASAPSEPVRRASAAFGDTNGGWSDSSVSDSRSLGDLASAAPEVRFPDPVAAIDAQNATSEKTALAIVPVKPAVPVSVNQARALRSAARVGTPPSQVGARLEAKPVAATAIAHGAPLSAKVTTAPGAVDPMEKIRAQVAQRLRAATPVAATVRTPPALRAGAPASIAPDSIAEPLRPAKGPSLFPVSGVN